jgi:hypothetical protein
MAGNYEEEHVVNLATWSPDRALALRRLLLTDRTDRTSDPNARRDVDLRIRSAAEVHEEACAGCAFYLFSLFFGAERNPESDALYIRKEGEKEKDVPVEDTLSSKEIAALAGVNSVICNAEETYKAGDEIHIIGRAHTLAGLDPHRYITHLSFTSLCRPEAQQKLIVTCLEKQAHLDTISLYVQDLSFLDADLSAIRNALKAHPSLKRIVIHVPGHGRGHNNGKWLHCFLRALAEEGIRKMEIYIHETLLTLAMTAAIMDWALSHPSYIGELAIFTKGNSNEHYYAMPALLIRKPQLTYPQVIDDLELYAGAARYDDQFTIALTGKRTFNDTINCITWRPTLWEALMGSSKEGLWSGARHLYDALHQEGLRVRHIKLHDGSAYNGDGSDREMPSIAIDNEFLTSVEDHRKDPERDAWHVAALQATCLWNGSVPSA